VLLLLAVLVAVLVLVLLVLLLLVAVGTPACGCTLRRLCTTSTSSAPLRRRGSSRPRSCT
jgi:hypothetical protein